MHVPKRCSFTYPRLAVIVGSARSSAALQMMVIRSSRSFASIRCVGAITSWTCLGEMYEARSQGCALFPNPRWRDGRVTSVSRCEERNYPSPLVRSKANEFRMSDMHPTRLGERRLTSPFLVTVFALPVLQFFLYRQSTRTEPFLKPEYSTRSFPGAEKLGMDEVSPCSPFRPPCAD